MINQVIDESIDIMHDRLHGKAEVMQGHALNDQELREFVGILNPNVCFCLTIEKRGFGQKIETYFIPQLMTSSGSST